MRRTFGLNARRLRIVVIFEAPAEHQTNPILAENARYLIAEVLADFERTG